jgi:hypothetical protein
MKPPLTMLIPLIRMILVIAVLVFFIAPRSHATTEMEHRCFEFAQKVLKAQQLLLTDKRPNTIVRSQFIRTTPGNRDDVTIAWAFATTRKNADFRMMVQDAYSQCDAMGFGYMYEIYVGDGR